jgi:sensor histidine kinase YesM
MTTNRRRGYVLRMALVNTGVAVVVLLLFLGESPSMAGFFRNLGVSLVFANVVGGSMALLMPTIGRRVARLGSAEKWTVLVTAVTLIAVAGSIVSIALLFLVGHIPRSDLTGWVFNATRASVVISLTFGIAVTLYETPRARLEHTTLALRTKERDEAEARRLATEAQLASLESRVQPHFLFNTLNSIAALIPQDPHGAERMIGQLAALMRASLDAGLAPLVPLEKELKNVRHYLGIEHVRFGDRLRYSIESAPGLESTLVPVLSLQTLVENAVKYAVSARREGAAIVVRAEPVDAAVRIVVEDDGPGFDASAMPEHHGLALLRDRLRLLYEGRARLDMKSEPGHTLVTLTVPR